MLCRYLSLRKHAVQQFRRIAELKFSLLYFSQIGIACRLSRTRLGGSPDRYPKRKDRALYCKPLPLLVPLVMSHIANMWELTPRKWTPEGRKEGRNLLRANCPWQVTALLSVWFSILRPPFILICPLWSLCSGKPFPAVRVCPLLYWRDFVGLEIS